jgi:hypothetical protein
MKTRGFGGHRLPLPRKLFCNGVIRAQKVDLNGPALWKPTPFIRMQACFDIPSWEIVLPQLSREFVIGNGNGTNSVLKLADHQKG